MPPPLSCFVSIETTCVAICTTLIKHEPSLIILPPIGVKQELEEEEDKENVTLLLKKRRVHKVYKKEIHRQRAGDINLPERVTHIELHPYNPLLPCLQYKF